MRDAGLQDSVRFALAGRTFRHPSSDYGRGYRVARLHEEICKVEYPGLDLSHLYPRSAASASGAEHGSSIEAADMRPRSAGAASGSTRTNRTARRKGGMPLPGAWSV